MCVDLVIRDRSRQDLLRSYLIRAAFPCQMKKTRRQNVRWESRKLVGLLPGHGDYSQDMHCNQDR